MDLLFSFDDTGSMYSIRQQVRRKLLSLTNSLFEKIPDLRIGVIIHNDYCDAPRHLFKLDFTNDLSKLERFINQSSPQGGGDAPECYELALHEATTLSWESSKKAMVLIGDCLPHKKGERNSGITVQYDWREETNKLGAMGVQIYGVQALDRAGRSHFYQGISDATGGIKLDLNQFQHINTYLQAIAFRQESEDALQNYYESDSSHATNVSLSNMFSKLWSNGSKNPFEIKETTSRSGGKLGADELSRFQIYDIFSHDAGKTTKAYIKDQGQTFRKGRSYYQLVKSENVQADKQVLMVHKASGVVNSDTYKCREMLGVPYGIAGKIRKSDYAIKEILREYDVFIQSNSYNRKLDPNTKFMYEIEIF